MEVSLDFKGETVSAGAPSDLFQTHVVAPAFSIFQYRLMADGRFVINSLKPGAPLTMVSGWTDLLRRRLRCTTGGGTDRAVRAECEVSCRRER